MTTEPGQYAGRRHPRRVAFLLCLAWPALLALSGCGERPVPPRHVVLISLDTTRADHIGAYGSSVATPNIDAMAARGVVFENVNVASTMTLPSHVSMLTGFWPKTHGVLRNGYTVHERNRMLPEILAEAGFRNAGFSAAVALSDLLDFPQGFHVWDQDPERMQGHVVANQEARRAEEITDAALAYLAGQGADRHFLFVHYVDPHLPYDPPEPYRSMAGAAGPLTGDFDTVQSARALHRSQALSRPLSSDPIPNRLDRRLVKGVAGQPLGTDEALARLYAGEVMYMDDHLGRLFEGLEAQGILDDALVLVTSDHGETFWEHADVWNHGMAVYQTTAHVPMILRFPGDRFAGTRVAQPVSNIDVTPTILDALGLSWDDGLDGQSLLPLLRGRSSQRERVFTEGPRVTGIPKRPGRWGNEIKAHSVRHGRWKFVSTPYMRHEELYDLEADPGERTNLLLEPTPEVAQVAAELREELAAWIASADPLPSKYFPRVTQGMTAQERRERQQMEERLRALGYVEGSDDDEAEAAAESGESDPDGGS